MIGLIAAMDTEIEGVVSALSDVKTKTINNLTFYVGNYNDKSFVVVASGVGKVQASLAFSTLINYFEIDYVINFGVAGSINNSDQKVIVVSKAAQTDFDTTFFGDLPGAISPSGEIFFYPDPTIKSKIETILTENKIDYSVEGLSTGDSFISSLEKGYFISTGFAVTTYDMEGAAILLCAKRTNIKTAVVKVISDSLAECDYKSNIKTSLNTLKDVVVKIIQNL